jgi:Arc/MetJ-type ribon-helix-helix transcriptional regulator
MATKDPTPLIALRVPLSILEQIDRLARQKYISRSDAVRDAMRLLLRTELAGQDDRSEAA